MTITQMLLVFQGSLSGALQRRAVLLGSGVWHQHLRRREYAGISVTTSQSLLSPQKPHSKVWIPETRDLIPGPPAKFRPVISATIALVSHLQSYLSGYLWMRLNTDAGVPHQTQTFS